MSCCRTMRHELRPRCEMMFGRNVSRLALKSRGESRGKGVIGGWARGGGRGDDRSRTVALLQCMRLCVQIANYCKPASRKPGPCKKTRFFGTHTQHRSPPRAGSRGSWTRPATICDGGRRGGDAWPHEPHNTTSDSTCLRYLHVPKSGGTSIEAWARVSRVLRHVAEGDVRTHVQDTCRIRSGYVQDTFRIRKRFVLSGYVQDTPGYAIIRLITNPTNIDNKPHQPRNPARRWASPPERSLRSLGPSVRSSCWRCCCAWAPRALASSTR